MATDTRSEPEPTEPESNTGYWVPIDWAPRQPEAYRTKAETTPGPPAIDLLARRNEKKRSVNRIWLRRGLWASCAVLVVGVILWVIFASPLLALKIQKVHIKSSGGSFSEPAIHETLKKYQGVPLARLNLGQLEGQLRDQPSVQAVEVRRKWPDGLDIKITGRIPVAIGNTGAGPVLLDENGVRLGTPAGTEALPQVTIPLDAGDKTAKALEAVLSVLGQIPPELRADVAQVGAKDGTHVELVLRSGQLVRWGGAEESVFKSQVLAIIRQNAAPVYDVSVPRAPVAGNN